MQAINKQELLEYDGAFSRNASHTSQLLEKNCCKGGINMTPGAQGVGKPINQKAVNSRSKTGSKMLLDFTSAARDAKDKRN